MGLPRHNCKIGKTDDEWEIGLYRDRIGGVTAALWKFGVGFRDEAKVHHSELKRIRDWLNKVIEHVERP